MLFATKFLKFSRKRANRQPCLAYGTVFNAVTVVE